MEEDLPFPSLLDSDYQAKDLAGKAVIFQCKVHEVKRKVQCHLDDDFARRLGFHTLEDLRKAVKENIEQEKKAKIDSEYLESLLRFLVKASTIDVTPEQVRKSKEKILTTYQNALIRYGMGLDDYISALGMTREAFDAAIDGEAKNTAKTDVLTAYIAKRENLQATEEDLQHKVEDLKNYPKLLSTHTHN